MSDFATVVLFIAIHAFDPIVAVLGLALGGFLNRWSYRLIGLVLASIALAYIFALFDQIVTHGDVLLSPVARSAALLIWTGIGAGLRAFVRRLSAAQSSSGSD